MRVLVIGSGAREHALLWKLAQSRRVTRLWAAPGNPGMAALAECVPIGAHELERLADFAEREAIDFTVVGPEAPLIAGLVDVFEARGLPIFGPRQAGALLEGSKAFAKELMEAAGIPTAQHRSFRDPAAALAYLEEHGAPVVVKADGNAAGKGAIVALDLETARRAVRQMMVERVFGSAGEVVVIEDYLQGDEIGSTALCNGTSFVPLVLTQDHKRALDNDEGLNTGGMGAYAPLPFVSAETERAVQERIIAATLRALQERGIAFSGVLYSNIMLTERGPMVLEHNVRFGDPETQAMMLLLESDVDLLTLLQEPQRLASVPLWRPGYAVSLTLASGGYPGSYRTGLPIQGLAEASRLEQVQVFHAGTALRDGELVTAGGRVLSVAAYGATLAEALERAYEAARLIHFEGMHYRRDIARRGLRALQS
ncbi:phosphoribosylamine--glycine ligase [Thermogemmatispora sp.]|uniref:phosphoribosylamine--glycine ligase n=1 Tax=Thermogemmatispora sp. TaxID=1968838 RepID=UPI001D859368|nr:phosphoribosylamine--glycine ligase [Thermogemmatispora sp.]MBX5450618.1 phosphoribosylamine--glycine ligase [Thermogemmatispora sp.]